MIPKDVLKRFANGEELNPGERLAVLQVLVDESEKSLRKAEELLKSQASTLQYKEEVRKDYIDKALLVDFILSRNLWEEFTQFQEGTDARVSFQRIGNYLRYGNNGKTS